MRKNYFILFLSLLFLKTTIGFGVSHTIVPTGNYPNFMFSPATVSANVGDSIIFNLGPDHFPKEVSQATWNANDSNSLPGGFVLPYGGGTIVVDSAKTYYYVCGVHFAMGMKGVINVTGTTGINALINIPANLEIFPNPVSSGATIKTNLPAGRENQIRIFDMTGKCIYQKNNISPVHYLDLSEFSSGTYFVAIKSEDIFLEQKLIVSK